MNRRTFIIGTIVGAGTAAGIAPYVVRRWSAAGSATSKRVDMFDRSLIVW